MKYTIKGKYRGRTEDLDSANTEEEARYLCNEYQLAYGTSWSVWYELSTHEIDTDEQE